MKKNIFGFTLIELMVTITVIMVLVGVGSMSLSNFNGIKELEVVANQVTNQIKLARNLAVTRQLSEVDDTKYVKYVRVRLSGNSVVAEGIDSGGVVHTSPPYFSSVVNTKSDIQITFGNTFGFMRSTGRLTDVDGNLVGTTMTVLVARGSNQKVININSLGVVSNVN